MSHGRLPADPPPEPGTPTPAGPPPENRRDFLGLCSAATMAAGLAAGYGTFGWCAARFLYPAGAEEAWQLVAPVAALKPGDSMSYRAPDGARVAITRHGEGNSTESFLALSSTCPHLGCQVSWEGPKDRFFCPCHNGTFDRTGKATGGPPGAAGQSLPRYPLKVEGGLLYVLVPTRRLAAADHPSPAGHDRCLGPRLC